MKNPLVKYLNDRLSEDPFKKVSEDQPKQGPVITISRQPGCGAVSIAEILQKTIKLQQNEEWQIISRQILLESAKELGMKPNKLNHILCDKERSIFSQILEAFNNKSFKSDRKIITTACNVIRGFADEGNTIIVGRGGASLCNRVKKAIHIRLTAPLDWRIDQIKQRLNISEEKAFSYIEREEARRNQFISTIKSEQKVVTIYDITINCFHFNHSQIANIIYNSAKTINIL